MPTQAERLFALFRGFSGAHGTYETEDFNPGKRKAEQKRTTRTLRQPVTVDLWERHLAGQYHLGIITINEENNCWWAAIDIDDYDIDHASLVGDLEGMGIPALVTRTKSGGAHVYLFFSEEISAREVMPRLRELAAALGRAESEVFPKQSRIATDLQGMGNWMNMPYFGGDDGRNYAVGKDGRGLSVERFLRVAEESKLSHREFLNLRFMASAEGFEEAPPCLEYLYSTRSVKQGTQNNALFNFVVYAKKVKRDGWQELILEWNQKICQPAYDTHNLSDLMRRHEKKDYAYRCNDVPCVNHCNVALCRTRKHGVGPGGDAEIIDSISILDSNPPLYYVTMKTGEIVECDVTALLSPRRFRELSTSQHHLILPSYKEDTWLKQVQRCIETAVRIEVPEEVGIEGQFGELLERFCTDQHSGDSPDTLIMGRPWKDDERRVVWFRFRDLREFLSRNKFDKMRDVQVHERIKKMGGSRRQFHTKTSTVNAIGISVDVFTWRSGPLPTPAREEAPI